MVVGFSESREGRGGRGRGGGKRRLPFVPQEW